MTVETNTPRSEILEICERSLHWAQERHYTGYSKFDALNSPLLSLMANRSYYVRAGLTFALSRMPINIRPFLLVKKKQNPKGLSLFARAYFNLWHNTHENKFWEEGLHMLDMLLGISQREHYSGHCWGYDHPWQNSEFLIPAYEPNTVVTVNGGEAFLQAYDLTGSSQYLDVCKSVADFIVNELNYIDVGPAMKCCSYDLYSSWKVINVNAIAASFLAKIFQRTGVSRYRDYAQAMMQWVLSQKTVYHAWYYTDPPEHSRITHDGYHTGFVLDALLDYQEIFPDAEIELVFYNALEYYRANLFSTSGAPRWMYDCDYPRDIHACAQGIITFSKASTLDPSYLDIARKVLQWTLTYLYSWKDSRFYYQKGRYWTKRFTLMRWCQAWMVYGMSVYLFYQKQHE